MKITRIESREYYEVPKRPHFIMSLSKGTVDLFMEGRDMREDEIGSALIQYVSALNAAEKQIEFLINIINKWVDADDLDEYLEEYPEDEDYKSKYKIEDIKDALFNSMMKKNEKLISKYINQLNLATEKL